MATMNISLPEKMKKWVEAQVEKGTYANSSDYVRDTIRKDIEKRQAIAELQAAIDEGINSGPSIPWDVDEFLKEMHKQADEAKELVDA
jgi:antitoxin ParD1/3/4